MWDLKNIVERAISTAIFTFVGSFGGSEVAGGIPNGTQVKVALWATGMATLLSVAKNLTAEGVVVESANRARSAAKRTKNPAVKSPAVKAAATTRKYATKLDKP